MADPLRPAGPARHPNRPPGRAAPKPHETLPEDIQRRPLEDLHLARPQMHPIQRRPDPAPPANEEDQS